MTGAGDPAGAGSCERLFSPLTVGPVELPCRVVSTSHQTTLVHEHLPTEDFVAYQEARARGGTGLIVMEAVAVAPSGLLTAHTLGGYLPAIEDGYRRVAAAVQPHGTKLFVQLFHGGRELISSAPRLAAVSASALPSARYHTEPRALRTAEVRELIDGYARCAALAAAAGLDGIEITAAHGYLGEQFFSPEYNLRDDEYGEPARFITDVLEAVRAAAPGLALGVRLSADSLAAQAIAPALAPLVDYVHLAVGNSSTFDGCTGIVPPPPSPRNLIAELTEPFRLGPALIATTRIVDPVEADALITQGVADAVGMTRALITDPDMPRKARSGDTRAILRCIGCNACIAHYHAETPIRCAQNPRTGRERSLPPAGAETGVRRRVVVVGAGPAGLAAAGEAGAAAHEVVVLERGDRIGGQMEIAAGSPGHREQAAALVANYEALLDRPNVELRLGVTADADLVAELRPDVVVLATGARPAPPRQNLEDVAVVQAWEVLTGAPVGDAVLIADWGGDTVGLDCAEVLAARGCRVTLAVGAVMPGETVHQYARNQYLGRLARAGVRIEHYAGLHAASGGHVHFRNVFAPELETAMAADTLVLSLGRVPNDGLRASLSAVDVPVVEAGDCLSPRGLEEAILEGTLSVRSGLLRCQG